MSKSTAIIDDAGFNKLYTGGKSATDTRHTEPPSGNPQPERSTERVAGFDTVSPFDIIGGTGDGSANDRGDSTGDNAPKRRGRPPGSKNRETVSKNLANLEDILFTVHLSLAQFTFEELALDESEAKAQADAYRELAKYYNFYIDPKKMAMIQLAAVLGKHYGTRAVAIYSRLKAEAEVKAKSKPAAIPIRSTPTKETTSKESIVNGYASEALGSTLSPKRDASIAEVPSQIWPEGGDNTLPED